MSPRHLLAYATRSLLRGGGRSLLAVLCIAFGVLSLVAMLLLSAVIRDATVVEPRLVLGGDLSLTRTDGRPLQDTDIAALERLQADGVITAFSPVLPVGVSMARTTRTSRVQFVSRAIGVDPATWPLAGTVEMLRPEGAPVAGLLAEPDAALVTRDLARSLALDIGDALLLGGAPGQPPVRLRVAGIARALPDRRGDTVLLPLAAAHALAGGGTRARAAAILTREPPGAFAEWAVRTPEDARREQGSAPGVFDFALKGAGLLGLLVGGIGVANTLHVVLARRTAEIAVLKTIGYRRATLFALFAVETCLLGVIGSVLGAAGALAVARRLATLLERTEGTLLIEYAVDPASVAAGIVIGTVTAVLFGMQAILRAAAVRPATLLRQLPGPAGARSRVASAGLLGALFVACLGVGALVMGSAVRGAVVVAAGLAGLVLLGALHAGLLFLVVRLPAPAPLLRLAQRNLRHRPLRALFAVVALFTGVFTIGFAGATFLSGRDRVESRRGSLEGLNLTVHARVQDAPRIEGLLGDADATDIVASTVLRVLEARTEDGAPLRLRELAGRSAEAGTRGLTLLEGEWRGEPGTVLLPGTQAGTGPALGSVVRIATARDTLPLRVTGRYAAPVPGGFGAGQPTEAFVDDATAARLAGDDAALVVRAHLPAASIDAAATAIGAALPDAFVVSRADLNALLIRAYEGLFAFVAGIAGLALLAGAVLVANTVGLGLLERRRELGILKAIGWSRARVLVGVLLENGLLGALAAATGLAGVAAAIAITSARVPAAGIALAPGTAVLLAGGAVAIALLAALLVAWRPVRLRPLAVLREE